MAKIMQLTKDYAWAEDIDFGEMGRTCDQQLDHTQKLLADGAFDKRLDGLLSAAKGKLASE